MGVPGRIQSVNNAEEEQDQVGLKNIGNTCHVNSLLQTMFGIRSSDQLAGRDGFVQNSMVSYSLLFSLLGGI